MSQQRASRDEATSASKNSADDERSFFFLDFATLWPYSQIQSEYIDNEKTLIQIQLLLIIFWSYTTHESQGKTLDIAIIYVGGVKSAMARRWLLHLVCIN